MRHTEAKLVHEKKYERRTEKEKWQMEMQVINPKKDLTPTMWETPF